jgi:hypothetical protein
MKKIYVLVLTTFFALNLQAQDSSDERNTRDSFEKMHRQMMKQFEQMFRGDSSGNFSFKFDTTFTNGDAMTRSFGFMFDGNNWKSMSPDSLGQNGSMKGFFGDFDNLFQGFDSKSFDLSDMMKRFEQMMPNGMDMPRMQPYDQRERKRKGDADKKEKKYETEKL